MLVFETNDYAQNSIWATTINSLPFVKSMLAWFTSGITLDFGGLTHRGSKTYTIESFGVLYIILFVFLFFADIQILGPVLRNDISYIGTDQVHVNKTG